MTRRSPLASCALWLKRLLLGVVLALLCYLLWLFAWVQWWGRVNPETTNFMEIRLAELQATTPAARLTKQWTPYAGISPHLKRALVASEDDLFVEHNGFDWVGIQRALDKNRRRGHIVAGGSTITQQLAKNLFLSPDKTPLRKLEEAAITVMIEASWSKRRIFEVYLNVIEWGNGVFGAEAAARRYFGVSASQLSAGQAAYLAAMVPSPRYYDRNRNAPALVARATSLLGRMPAAQIP